MQTIENQEKHLQQGYEAVLAEVSETASAMERLKPSITLVFGRNKLREAVSSLDGCAEKLDILDRHLSNITRMEGDVDSKLNAIRTFAGLFEKGNAVYMSLCQAYRSVHELNDRRDLYLIFAMIAAAMTAVIISLI
jgi:hypothetical protein